jgi:ABC-type nitrate/sulfonate/bicarbonate transport system permease component
VWEAGARLLGAGFIARPTAVVVAMPEVFATEVFWQNAWETVGAVIYGVFIGAVVGLLLGLAMGRIQVVRLFFTPYVSALYTLPMVAVVPLMTIWFGYSSQTRLVAVALSAFLPIVVTTADGSRAIPKEYLDVARTFRAKWHNVWFGIALRNAIPYLIAGLQLAIARALVTAVAVEFLAGVPGLGYWILMLARSFQQNEAFVGVILLTLFVVCMRALLTLARRRFLPWYVG